MPTELTPKQRIALVEELEAQESKRRGKAARMAWLSVAAATLVLAAIVFGAWRELAAARATLEKAERRRVQVENEIKALEETKADVEVQLEKSRAALSASLGALGRVSAPQRKAAIEQHLDADPEAALALPRVYLQVVDPRDRGWAVETGRRLEPEGMISLGVETVTEAAGLERSEVRYYKTADKPNALRIVALLKTVGVDAKPEHLERYEDSTEVKGNHFEVWFAAGARNDLRSAADNYYFRIQAKHSGKYLDVLGKSLDAGANVGQWQDNPGDQQKWLFERVPDVSPEWYYIISKHSGLFLDVLGHKQDSGAPVGQWTKSKEPRTQQQWSIEDDGSRYFRIRNRNSGKYLDVLGKKQENGAYVGQWEYSSGDQQRWRITKAERIDLPDPA